MSKNMLEFDNNNLIGKNLEEASKICEKHGLYIRILHEDGDITNDFDPMRINVILKSNNIIKKVDHLG